MGCGWGSGGISQLQEFPLSVGSKPQPGSPAQNDRVKKRCPHSIWPWNAVGFLPARKTRVHWRHRHPLKGTTYKILFVATHPGLQQRKGGTDKSHMRGIWALWLWGDIWVNSHRHPHAESFSHTTDAIFHGWSTPLCASSAWRNTIAPPCRLPHLLPCRGYTLLRCQLPGSRCRGLGSLREYQWLSCVAVGGSHSVYFPMNLTGTSPPERSNRATL